jgi:hypothetical protein
MGEKTSPTPDSMDQTILKKVQGERSRAQIWKDLDLIIKILILGGFLGFFFWYSFAMFWPYYQYDYYVYQSIYMLSYDQWYKPETLYYYSPLFYVIFYPFRFMGYYIFVVIGVIIFSYGIILTIKRLDIGFWIIMALNIASMFWFIFFHGNIDLYLFGILIDLWVNVKNEKLRGLILGLLTFKGSVIYVFPCFLWKSQDRKQFVFFTAMGIFLNYVWLVLPPVLLWDFLQQITFSSHPTGPQYLFGMQYPWLWEIFVLFITDLIEALKCRQLAK